jgi:hypothetical protein
VNASADLAAAIDAYNRHDLAAYKRLHTPDARIRFADVPTTSDSTTGCPHSPDSSPRYPT